MKIALATIFNLLLTIVSYLRYGLNPTKIELASNVSGIKSALGRNADSRRTSNPLVQMITSLTNGFRKNFLSTTISITQLSLFEISSSWFYTSPLALPWVFTWAWVWQAGHSWRTKSWRERSAGWMADHHSAPLLILLLERPTSLNCLRESVMKELMCSIDG